MADVTDTYTAKLLIEAQQTVSQLKQMEENVKAYIVAIKEAQKQTELSASAIGEAIKRSVKESKKLALDEMAAKGPPAGMTIQERQREITKQYQLDLAALKTAIQMVNKEQQLAAESARKYYGDAGVGTNVYKQKIDELKNSMMQLAQQQNATLQQAASGMKLAGVAPNAFITQAQKELSKEANATVAFLNAMKGIDQAATTTKTNVSGLVDMFRNLGSVGQYVFGTVLGLSAINALRNLIALFTDVIKKGLEFQYTLFTMEVAVRGLQRAGMDTTLKEWDALIVNVKKQFPIFPKQQITEAVSLAALMTREFGFTANQIEEVVKMSAILAELTGKDLHEAVRGITYAIGSGYFESLQRVGINISRQIVAEEALRQGYEGSYTALDQNVRAMITYNIIQKNLMALQDDAGRIVEESTGQVIALKAAFNDLKTTLGEMIVSSGDLTKRIRFLASFMGTLVESIVTLQRILDNFSWGELFTTKTKDIIPQEKLQDLQNAMNKIKLIGFHKDFEESAKAVEELRAALLAIQSEFPAERLLGDIGTERPRKTRDEMLADIADWKSKITNITQEINDAVEEEERDAAQRRKEIWEDYFSDLEQLFIDHQRRMDDLEKDTARDLADIETGRLQDIEDENRNYANSVAEAAQESAGRRADAERKYRDQELIAELRFQERMRQLREGFLFDLEDAVRERDARQIIRLTRQYNMEREQLIREEEISKKERWLAYQRQLQDIDRQKSERMSRLYQEHVERLQEIDIQAERERQRAQLEFERKKADEELRYQQDKTDREAKTRDQLAQLAADSEARKVEIVNGLLKEHEATHNMVDAIAKEYEAVYGPGGRIDRAIAYYLSLLRGLGGTYANRPRSISPPDIPLPPKHAEGGTKIVTKPTYELFGEAGPEMVTFTPLSRAGVNVNRTQGTVPAGMGRGGGNGKLLIQLNLDAGLEYKIIDQAMSELADVVTHIERARK